MYPRKATFTILPAKHNLRNVIFLDTKYYSTKHLLKYSNAFRQFILGGAIRNITNIKKELLTVIEHGNLVGIIRKSLSSVPENLKNQSNVIIRSWTHQCECVVAQRFRRGQQMLCLYSKLWEERALKEFFRRMKHQVTKHGKEFVLGAVGITAYNWEANRIPDSEVQLHKNELEYMALLKQKTMVCTVCDNEKKEPNEKNMNTTCDCNNKKNMTYKTYDDWTVFIEKKDMIVWRKLHKSGSYEYKVYGSYDDVYADDFVNVQIDIDYRKQWDTTAVILDVIDVDPNPGANSDVIYWEMLWPRFFTNRDYVFKRRYMVDPQTQTILLVSKCTEHPNRPESSAKYRVKDYFSHMVIRPHKDYNSPGVKFGLTYYDNPGVNIPSAVTSWVAYRAMPEFLNRLREAAREYQRYCRTKGCGRVFNLRNFIKKDDDNKKTDNKRSEEQLPVINKDEIDSISNILATTTGESYTEKYPGMEVMTAPSPIIQAEVSRHNYWKYLQPTYYFS
ncbi:START domain [Popillia japonica]|uniref:Phosphatidylcholine transfer protein n=1 Tax=Popillia japonica TaxID=7064 RepID=A0AAW1L595_POPJA